MSWKLSLAVQKYGPNSAPQRTVLRILVDYVRDPGIIAWPGVETIAGEAALSERTTRTALRELERDGWITTKRGGGRKLSSVYSLTDKTRQLLPRLSKAKPGNSRSETRQNLHETGQNLHGNGAAAAPEPYKRTGK